jgi:transposase
MHLTFEETTQAEWLYELLQGFVAEVVVCDPRRNKLLSEGSKGDKADARKLAELLRTGMVRSVWHGRQTTRVLKEMVRSYETFAIDARRTMLRIKALYRSRGIPTTGTGVYQVKQREHWLKQLSEVGMQQRAAWLYQQLDHVRELRKQAKAAVLAEGQRHRAVELLQTIPQVGPLRAAQIVATAGTPHRFRTKRQFWSYSGLAVVTHTSARVRIACRPSRPAQQTGGDAGTEPQLQSPSQIRFHFRCDCRGRLPSLATLFGRPGAQRHALRYGAADTSAENCGRGSGDLEERRSVRS